ncbi:MAG: type VI secretion system protein TssA [Pseudomonadota bacterium]
MIDVDALLQSFGDDAPSGEDLVYDPDFSTLEVAATPGEEQQVGDSIIAAEEPEYAEVVRLADALLGRTKDLRVAVHLANASLHTDGLSGFEEALRYVRGCLEQYWDTCHPQLDEDDDNDPTERANAVLSLSDGDTILKSLRLAPLTKSRAFGGLSLRDIMVAEGEMTAPSDMDTVPDSTTVNAAFQDTDDEFLDEARVAISAMAEHVKVISGVFDEQSPGLGPDLTPLEKLIRDVGKKIASYAGGEAPVEDAVDDDAEMSTSGGGGAPRGGGGAINNSNDVLNTIDRVIDYYSRNEPSSPVPILLKRAKRLVSADFVTIMRDMAPGGIGNIAVISGIDEDEL